jgi:hypothetical protein
MDHGAEAVQSVETVHVCRLYIGSDSHKNTAVPWIFISEDTTDSMTDWRIEQWFQTDDLPVMTHNLCVWGKVIEGLDHMDYLPAVSGISEWAEGTKLHSVTETARTVWIMYAIPFMPLSLGIRDKVRFARASLLRY